MKKRYKKNIAIFLATVLTIVVVYLGFNKDVDQVYSMKVDNFERHLVELEAEQKNINKEIRALYADDDQTYIIQSLKEEKIDEVEGMVMLFEDSAASLNKDLFDLTARDQRKYTEKIEDSEMKDSVENFYISITDLRTKKELTNIVNSLFIKEYMKDATVNKDVYVTETLNTEQFSKANKRMNQKLKETELKNREVYSDRLIEGFKIAEEQLNDINRAIELYEELFNENGFLIVTDSEKIEEFRLVVEKIKNPEVQRTFDEYVRIAGAYELEEVEDEAEDMGEIDSRDSEEQETSNYRRPSNTGQTNSNSRPQSGQSNNNTSNKKPPSNQDNSNSKPAPTPEPEQEPKPEPAPEESEEPEGPEPAPGDQKPTPNPKPDPKPEDPDSE